MRNNTFILYLPF